jgi:hypothetical protein
MQRRGDCTTTEPSGQSFLSERYDTAIFCFSKDLPFSSTVPDVPAIPFIPAKEAKEKANAFDALISSFICLRTTAPKRFGNVSQQLSDLSILDTTSPLI